MRASNEPVLISLGPPNSVSVSRSREPESTGIIHVWFGPLGVNTQEVIMSAAMITRTNRTLYPDIAVVVDGSERLRVM